MAGRILRQSVLTLSGVELRVYVLDDGQRVIDADDMTRLFQAWEEDAPLAEDEAWALAEFLRSEGGL